MKTMQNEVTHNETIKKEISKPSFPDVRQCVLFYNNSQDIQFSNLELGITGNFFHQRFDNDKIEIKIHFKKGDYLSYGSLEQIPNIFLIQPNKDCPFLKYHSFAWDEAGVVCTTDNAGWIKKQINSNKDIPEICNEICSYDVENECLTIYMLIPHDYVLEYGTIPETQTIYFEFKTGSYHRRLDKMMG